MKKLFTLISIFLLGFSLSGQDEIPPINTDRPTWTESDVTTPFKHFQIETGFRYGWDKQDGISSTDLGYNSTLLRFGVNSRLEVRLGIAYAGLDKEDEIAGEKESFSGMAPLMAGIKWNFLYGDGPIPSLAFLTAVDIPQVASDNFNDGNVLNTFKFAGSWKLSNTFGLAFNFGSIIDWKESNWTPLYTSMLTISIAKWLGAFVELYGFLPAGEYSDHRFDLGLVFPVRHNLQFDISGGMGISKNSPDGYGSFGLSWRIPR
ncbi:MAG TPA: transporter [Bacteroidales bacterium]|nr:transporter [Bacteroidales bacterium]